MSAKLSGRVDVGRLVHTPLFQKAQLIAASAYSHAAIALFHGAPGLGKTVAARRFASSLDGKHLAYVAVAGRTTPLGFARAILTEMTGMRGIERETLWRVTRALRDTLWCGANWFLIIDEAQRLNLEHYEYLRDLHDHEAAAFTLLFVGNHEAWTVIGRRPMLRDRILHRLEFKPLSPTDVRSFLPRYDAMYEEASSEVVAHVAALSKGEFRWLAQFTLLARDVLQRADLTTLNIDAANAACTLMARGGSK